MRRLALLLLCACSLPDEVGVGTNASRYDFLGGDGNAPYFEVDQGDSYGLHAWASWQLKPQRFTLVESEKPWQPNREPSVIVNAPAAESNSAVDTAIKVGGAIDSMDVSTKWLAGVLALASVVALIVWRGRIPFLRYFFPRKPK